MKKISLLLVILVICTLLISGNTQPFRLHVIANSDSAQDQQVKLLVRDAVLAATKEGILSCKTKMGAEEYIESHLATIEGVATKTLEDNGFSYDVEAMVGVYAFPDKTYGNMTYPAGEYPALKVVLGDGEGQNWWCVMFPPLCIVNTEAEAEEEVEYTSFILMWLGNLFGWEGLT